MTTNPGQIVCGNGPAVVLLHSSMSSKEQWKSLMALLAPKFKLISIDLAGYGDNDLPLNPQTFSTNDEITLVEQAIATHSEPREAFHLVGHSYGGAVALKLTLRMQTRIKSLTIFEPVVFHLLPPGESAHNDITAVVDQFAGALNQNDKRCATKLFINYWSGKGTFEKLSPKNQDEFIRYIDKVWLDFKALFSESLFLEDYARIRVPVCMIKGARSPISSLQVFDTLSKVLPACRVRIVPGGHMSPLTHVKQVNRIIKAFLTRQASG